MLLRIAESGECDGPRNRRKQSFLRGVRTGKIKGVESRGRAQPRHRPTPERLQQSPTGRSRPPSRTQTWTRFSWRLASCFLDNLCQSHVGWQASQFKHVLCQWLKARDATRQRTRIFSGTDLEIRRPSPVPGGFAGTRAIARHSGITVAMCSSLSCRAVTGVGLCAMRSWPFCVLGKAITSRMLVVPQSSAHIRSSPNAMPPCGGAP